MRKMRIGFVGVGAISGIYLENLTKRFNDELEIIGVCDLIRERAENAVKKYNIPKLYKDMHELFADPEVDIVLNITRPDEHFEVTKAALLAGKHVYSEKPLASTLEGAKELVALALEKHLELGGAPDTFMGAGIQTCRKLIDDGVIGTPVGAAGFMICRGHETWHPDPEFYYKRGGGPMLDMGPYYVTAMLHLLGEVSDVYAMTKKSFPERMITSEPHKGEVIHVDVDTYVAGTLRFSSGAIGTLFTTFDAYYPFQARVEVYGSEGTLFVPDPNCFGGPVKVFKPGEGTVEIPLVEGYPENSRGLGIRDMARHILSGSEFRCSWRQTLHALEVMEGFSKSGRERREVAIESKYQRSSAL